PEEGCGRCLCHTDLAVHRHQIAAAVLRFRKHGVRALRLRSSSVQEKPMSFIRRMDHFTIVTTEPEKTKEFYGALGLHPGARPAFQVPGFWLYADEGKPILHVIVVKQMPNPVRGGLDHMAFRGENLMAV